MPKRDSEPDDENPEWTIEDFRRARPALEVLPPEIVANIRRYRGQRGPQKTPTKELISLRVDREIVAAYRATGSGWQTRACEALKLFARRGLKARATADRRKARKAAKRRAGTKLP